MSNAAQLAHSSAMPAPVPASAAAPTITMDRQFGAILEGRWVPAPRFVLRRDRILSLVKDLPKGRVIEVGCGSGSVLRDLADSGHQCNGVETSTDAVAVARQLLAPHADAQILDASNPAWDSEFDLLMSFEVLEHIEHDHAALKDWVRWLKPGGKVIVSVPAHMQMWSQRDAWAGHFRRYGKEDLLRLAEAAGLKVERVECYGFPLSNLTHWLGNVSVRGQDHAGGAGDQDGATAASGTDRTTAIKYFGLQRSWWGRLLMAAACQIQKPFLRTRLGDGYLLVASKP